MKQLNAVNRKKRSELRRGAVVFHGVDMGALPPSPQTTRSSLYRLID